MDYRALDGYLDDTDATQEPQRPMPESELERALLTSRLADEADAVGLETRLGFSGALDHTAAYASFDGAKIGVRADEVEDDERLYFIRYASEDGARYQLATSEEARDVAESGYEVELYRMDAIEHDMIDEPLAGFYGYIMKGSDRFVINRGTADRPDMQADTAKHEMAHYFMPNLHMSGAAYEEMILAMTSTYATKEQPRTIASFEQRDLDVGAAYIRQRMEQDSGYRAH